MPERTRSLPGPQFGEPVREAGSRQVSPAGPGTVWPARPATVSSSSALEVPCRRLGPARRWSPALAGCRQPGPVAASGSPDVRGFVGAAATATCTPGAMVGCRRRCRARHRHHQCDHHANKTVLAVTPGRDHRPGVPQHFPRTDCCMCGAYGGGRVWVRRPVTGAGHPRRDRRSQGRRRSERIRRSQGHRNQRCPGHR